MLKKLNRVSVILLFALSLSLPAKAQTEEKQALEVSPAIVEKEMPNYKLTLKELIEEAKRNIKKAQERIDREELLKKNLEKEARARAHFEKGNSLYIKGNLKEAVKEWQEALDITKDPEMKGYVHEIKKRAKEELPTAREEKENKRFLAEKKRQEELMLKKAAAEKKKEDAKLKKLLKIEERKEKISKKYGLKEQSRIETLQKRQEIAYAKKEAARQKKEGRIQGKQNKEEKRARALQERERKIKEKKEKQEQALLKKEKIKAERLEAKEKRNKELAYRKKEESKPKNKTLLDFLLVR